MNCKVCGNTSAKNTSLSFFRFPKENNKCKDWAERCNMLSLYEKHGTLRFYKSFRICSEHFDPKDIVFDGRKKRLLQSAIPQILIMTQNIKKKNLKDMGNLGRGEIFQLNSVKNLCRLCAKENKNLTDIYGWKGKILNLEAKLKYFPLVINKCDVLPLKICFQCISKVNLIHDFIINCIKAETKLRIMLNLEDCDASCRRIKSTAECQQKVDWTSGVKKSVQEIPNFISVKKVHDSFDSVKKVHDSFDSVKKVHDSFDSVKKVHDSFDSVKKVHDSFDSVKKVHDSFDSVKKVHDSFDSVKKVHVSFDSVKKVHDSFDSVKKVHDSFDSVKKVHDSFDSVKKVHDSFDSVKKVHDSFDSVKKVHDSFDSVKKVHNSFDSVKKVHDSFDSVTCYSAKVKDNYYNQVQDNSLNKKDASCFSKQPELEFSEKNQLNDHTNFIRGVDFSGNISFEHDYSNMILKNQLHSKVKNHDEVDQKFANETKHPCNICLESLNSSETPNSCSVTHSVESELLTELFCKACNKFFFNRVELDEHVSQHLEGSFVRKISDKKFHKVFLKKHLFDHKLNNSCDCITNLRFSVPQKRKCRFCERLYNNRQVGLMHEKSHDGETPYKCKQCRKTFRSKRSLRQHRSVHSDKRLYNCEECGMSFKRKDTLSNHLRIHTGERPFVCKVCGFAFKQRGDCMKHEKNHQKTCKGDMKSNDLQTQGQVC